MGEAPVVFVPTGEYAAGLLKHRGPVEAAGGVVEVVDLDDPNARRAVLARATAGAVATTALGEQDFAAAPKLRAVISRSIGVNHIDLEAATRHGVMIGNVPDLCTEEVADHTLMLLLACYRRLSYAVAQLREGQPNRWEILRAPRPWPRLRGLTAGLLGFGNIARAVAVRCQAFGLRVIAHDPYVDPQMADRAGVELVSLDDLLRDADYLSVHVPLNPATRHLVDAAALAKMKRTAFLINTARGAVVDEAALVQALRDGAIAGAGLDVFEVEPPQPDNPLLSMPNVLATPHIGGYSDFPLEWGPESAMRDAAAVIQGGRPRSIQNPEVLARLEADRPSRA